MQRTLSEVQNGSERNIKQMWIIIRINKAAWIFLLVLLSLMIRKLFSFFSFFFPGEQKRARGVQRVASVCRRLRKSVEREKRVGKGKLICIFCGPFLCQITSHAYMIFVRTMNVRQFRSCSVQIPCLFLLGEEFVDDWRPETQLTRISAACFCSFISVKIDKEVRSRKGSENGCSQKED